MTGFPVSSKGLAAKKMVLIISGTIALLLAIYFLHNAVQSQDKAFTENDCKSIMINQCGICIFGLAECRLDTKSLDCIGILGNLGISVGSDGSFERTECDKLTVRDCGSIGKPCCYDSYCGSGVCDESKGLCVEQPEEV